MGRDGVFDEGDLYQFTDKIDSFKVFLREITDEFKEFLVEKAKNCPQPNSTYVSSFSTKKLISIVMYWAWFDIGEVSCVCGSK